MFLITSMFKLNSPPFENKINGNNIKQRLQYKVTKRYLPKFSHLQNFKVPHILTFNIFIMKVVKPILW